MGLGGAEDLRVFPCSPLFPPLTFAKSTPGEIQWKCKYFFGVCNSKKCWVKLYNGWKQREGLLAWFNENQEKCSSLHLVAKSRAGGEKGLWFEPHNPIRCL